VQTQQWSIDQAKQLYAIQQWGDGYFSINTKGHVSVKPELGCETEIDLFEIALALQKKRLELSGADSVYRYIA